MNPLDHFITGFDGLLRTALRVKIIPRTPSPGDQSLADPLTEAERSTSIALMRVNHTGEICAQGLYNGQALCASDQATAQSMTEAAAEELDHLAWCRTRLDQLGGQPSVLDPLWYLASFAIGAGTALISDRVSLGFVHATEENVARHLREHLSRLSHNDHASRHILTQMLDDEIRHGQTALDEGGEVLPEPIKRLMWEGAKLMTKTSAVI